jgi:exopolysaccharide biosynthesis polyprenyl glycosylphosphotransferase
LGAIDTLKDYVQNHLVDYIYVALPMRAEKKMQLILSECRTLGSQIFLVPDIYSFMLLNAEIESIGDMLILNFNPRKKVKRLFDVVFSSLFLLITLPIGIIIAILIKLEDGGPVFYGHSRITEAGRKFKCLKFRTMHVDADKRLSELLASDASLRKEWQRSFKLKNDPRITKVGRFLRKTSLDELPQFINVLKGEMSVVGARPIVTKELYDYYKEAGNLYCSANPGITGLWQIGKRSDTEDYAERVKLDQWYVLNNTFWLDMKIIMKTAWCMIKGKGAY